MLVTRPTRATEEYGQCEVGTVMDRLMIDFLIDHYFSLQVYEKLLRRGFPSRPTYHRHDKEGIRRHIPSRHRNPETTMRRTIITKIIQMIAV